MSDGYQTSPDDVLFQQWEAALRSTRHREPPDAVMLAAYLDGTLDAADCAAVEAALACNPDLIPVVFEPVIFEPVTSLSQVSGNAADAGSGVAPLSRALVGRLQALVPPSGADHRPVVTRDGVTPMAQQAYEIGSRSDLSQNRPGGPIIAFPSTGQGDRIGRSLGWRPLRGRTLSVRAVMAASLVFMSVAGFSAGISVERAINHDELHDAMLDFDEAALMDENVG